MTTIDEIEALLARATPGPWWNEGSPLSPTGKVHHGGACNRVLTCHNDVDGTTADANDNAALIVALRDAAPDLIAVVRAAAKVAQHPRFSRANDHGLIDALARLGVKL